ncbi:MAG: hypothetical protein M0R17_05940 [Candidatus Omnitrophica bacterium]|jgi:hypothetical protein|nr:hypothetical protein [Candidatus Omnitrophota bacterium]
MEKQKNNWKTTTILLGIIIIGLLSILIIRQANNNWKENICSKIKGTPSWVDSKGIIVDTGYKPIIQMSIENETDRLDYYTKLKIAVSGLIFNNITFVYNSNCGYCKKQIDEFKEIGFWDEYVNSGLTKEC